jgi:hypothetical protein
LHLRKLISSDFTHFQIFLSYRIALYDFERNLMEFHCFNCFQ